MMVAAAAPGKLAAAALVVAFLRVAGEGVGALGDCAGVWEGRWGGGGVGGGGEEGGGCEGWGEEGGEEEEEGEHWRVGWGG